VRIEVDPGGLVSATSDRVIQEITSAVPAVDNALEVERLAGGARDERKKLLSDLKPFG
jgi:hypothetical protein